jgi:hypothetical protein
MTRALGQVGVSAVIKYGRVATRAEDYPIMKLP